MNYRKDIQILRGVAVLLVVLFHLGLGAFKSGFLGVDVFFVISGYLMAAMYNPAEKQKFFSRRAMRLLPAYFVTILATLLAAMVITTPNDFVQVAEQARYAALFTSNIGFWAENSYFDKAAFKPLLHLWSLGVEIQFYLLVPGVYWLFRRTGWYGIAALGGLSLMACLLVLIASPKTSFFWLPFRLWEFLLGFSVATLLKRRGRPRAGQAVGVLCLLGTFLIPLLPVHGTAQNIWRGHPGFIALCIALATSVVLFTELPKRLLDNPMATALERLGNWSYSIYLAHFPVIVLALYEPFSGTRLQASGAGEWLATLALMIAFSTLLYAGVERPLRHIRLSPWKAAAPFAALLGLTVFGIVLQEQFVPQAERPIYSAWTDRAPYRCGKINRILHPSERSCEITANVPSPSSRVLLVGNSHADTIKTEFASAARSRNIAVFFIVDNTPLMRQGITPREVLQEAVSRGATAIVLHHSPGSVRPETYAEISRLAQERSIALSVIMPVPVWPSHVPKLLWAAHRHGARLPTLTLAEYEATNAAFRTQLEMLGVALYDVAPLLCTPGCRMTTDAGTPLYFDDDHLTLTGSSLLRPVFQNLLSDVVKQNRGS